MFLSIRETWKNLQAILMSPNIFDMTSYASNTGDELLTNPNSILRYWMRDA